MRFWKTVHLHQTILLVAMMLLLTLVAEGGERFLEGREAVSVSDYPRAVNLLKTAVVEDETNPEAWRLLGFSYWRLDSLQKAVAAYQQVLILRPADYDARLGLGAIFALQGSTGSSIAILSEILAVDSTDVEAWLGVGKSYSWQNDLTEAEAAYRQALFYLPGYPRSLLGLAEVLAWQSKSTEARVVYHQLLEIDSTYAEAWTGLGNSWYWTDHPYQALVYYDKAQQLDEYNQQLNQLITRVENEVEWSHQPAYTYWAEDDDGLITEHEKFSFSTEKRINDLFEITGRFSAYSSFRDSGWSYRRNLGVSGVIHTLPGLDIQPEADIDLLSGNLDLLKLLGSYQGNGSWSWFRSKLVYANSLYELWSDTQADGVWGEVTFEKKALFAVTAGAGKWYLSDKNRKNQVSVLLRITSLQRAGLTFLINSRYLDFQDNVVGYWTPQELRYDGVGLQYTGNLNSFIQLEASGEYAVNTDSNSFINLNGSIQTVLLEDYRISTGVSYFETDTDYRMLLWRISLQAGGLF
jgi:tetratricopeptide (TPR) repeat protein